MSYRVKAHLDKLSLWVSTFIVALSIILTLIGGLISFDLIPWHYRHSNSAHIPGYILASVGLLLTVVIFLVYRYKPTSYEIDEAGVHIHRGAGTYTIALDSILQVHKGEGISLFNTIRLFGSGGLFGYTGIFYNKQYGTLRLMATQFKNFVLIYTSKNKAIAITPDNADAFVEACIKISLSRSQGN